MNLGGRGNATDDPRSSTTDGVYGWIDPCLAASSSPAFRGAKYSNSWSRTLAV